MHKTIALLLLLYPHYVTCEREVLGLCCIGLGASQIFVLLNAMIKDTKKFIVILLLNFSKSKSQLAGL